MNNLVDCQVNCGEFLWRNDSERIYELLKYMDSGLLIDVGAAQGLKTKKMKSKSPQSEVICFEPFANNVNFLKRNLDGTSGINVIEKAVADQTSGCVNFKIPSIVTGNELGWEDSLGYCSVGHIQEANDADCISVPVTSLSVEVKQHVRFIKIDTQGGEAAVLRGCHNLINDYGVDIFYLEFIGQKEVLSFLSRRGYVIFDTPYMIIPNDINKINKSEWRINGFGNLSIGHKAVYAYPIDRPLRGDLYCDFLRGVRQAIGYIQTDLVAVHESFMADFLHAAGKAYKFDNV